MNKWQERNEKVIQEFRENGGEVAGWGGLILVTTKGAKTGQTRIIPLMRVSYNGHYLAVASKGGAVKDPEWYYNLVAYPEVVVEADGERFQARARKLTGEEREQAFARAIEVFPLYKEYQEKAPREIPVFLLERL